MIKFVHTADIHFGMENYGKIDAKTGIHTRLLDFERALSFCIDHAIAQNVDFFLFAGDAYKTTNPSPTQQRLLLKCFLRLQQANIPIVIIVGNHDNPLSFGKSTTLDMFGDLPLEGFHVIAKPRSFVINTKNGPVQIVGMPWPTRNSLALADTHVFKSSQELTEYLSQAAASIIQDFAQKLDDTIPAVLAGHLTVSSGVFSGSEKRAVYGNDPIFLPSDLGIKPFDYVALGHLHRHQNLNPHSNPPIVYSGSIERVDFGERKEDKGFCLVTIHSKQKTDYEFIKVPMRRFIQIEVHLNAQSDLSQTSQIIEEIKKHSIEDAIIKILYHVPLTTKDSVDLNAVQRACDRALDIVGIIPIHTPTSREKRLLKTAINMDMKTLLETYFNTKPECSEHKETLIKRALEIYHEQEDNKENIEEL